MAGVRRAIDRAGGATALARAVGVSRQTVAYWLSVGHVPSRHVDVVARLTGVPVRDLVSREIRKWIG